MSNEDTRAGMVAIVGLPNAGKSSLLNALLGTKLAIVTSAAQTTRQRVVGIDSRDGVQMIFLDTPGLVEPSYLLHESMLLIAGQAIQDADVVVLLLDGLRAPPDISPEMEARLKAAGKGLLVVINKVDIANPANVATLDAWSDRTFARRPLVISAISGDGVKVLRERIGSALPVSPFLYPDDELSTQNLRFFVAELVRETVFEKFREEIPYSIAVMVEEFRENVEPTYIRASIFVERASQKGILLGHKGTAIRDLGIESRAKIEDFLDTRVYLELRVKVLPKWRKDPLELKRLGFPLPPER